MLPWIVAGAAAAGFGGLALYSALTPTAKKVKKGDSVFVPPTALVPVDPTGASDASRFLSGFIASSIKVTNITPTANGEAMGSVVGLSPPVKFKLAEVTKIERNGKVFT